MATTLLKSITYSSIKSPNIHKHFKLLLKDTYFCLKRRLFYYFATFLWVIQLFFLIVIPVETQNRINLKIIYTVVDTSLLQ